MTSQEIHDEDMASQELPNPPPNWNTTENWQGAKDWHGLIQLNKTYLVSRQGRDPVGEDALVTNYLPAFGEVHLIPILLSFLDRGLFVRSSQDKQLQGSPTETHEATYEECKQAQCLEFFISDNDNGKRFIEFLLQDSQLQGVAFDEEGAKLTGSSETKIEVAWSRESRTKEDLSSMDWENHAFIPSTYESESHADLFKIKAFCDAHPMFCAIATLNDEVDLWKRVEEHVNAAGLGA